MASQSSIVPNALAYYDKVNHNYRSLFRKIASYRLEISADPNIPNNISFYDKDSNLLGSSNYQALGVYSRQHRLWVWAWSIPSYPAKAINLSRKLLTYGLDNEDANIRSELVTSRFAVTHPMNLDIHLAIASYLTRQVMYAAYVYPDPSDKTNYIINYIFLTDFNAAKAPTSWDEIQEHVEAKTASSIRYEKQEGGVRDSKFDIRNLFNMAIKYNITVKDTGAATGFPPVTVPKSLALIIKGKQTKVSQKEFNELFEKPQFSDEDETIPNANYFLIDMIKCCKSGDTTLLVLLRIARDIGRYTALLNKDSDDNILFTKYDLENITTYTSKKSIAAINLELSKLEEEVDILINYYGQNI